MTAPVTTTLKYDAVVYQNRDALPIAIAAGSGALSQKFCAYTAKLLKSVTLKPVVTGTSGTGDTVALYQISGTATTTYSAVGSFGSAATAFQTIALGATNSPPGIAVAAGDTFYIAKGTDATITYVGEFETMVQVGAAVTA